MCLFRKRKSDVGKIVETTDGFLSGNSKNKKKRKVAITQQRSKDGAIGVNKIRGLEGKDAQSKNYIPNLILDPKNHTSLTKQSIVETRTIWGVKKKPILPRDVKPTNDRLTRREQKKIKNGLGGATRQNKRTYKNTLRKWCKGFKGKKK